MHQNFRAVHNWGADGKILETTRAGAISQSDYRTTEILAEKSEIFITSLPNFMVRRKSLGFFSFFGHIDVRKYRKKKPRVRWAFLSMCRLLNKLASSVRMQQYCKTLGRHLNWTILTNERIIVVLTMERCRLWSVGQCFNGEGHFKKLTLFATSSKESKYSAFPLTEVSTSKVFAI